MLQIPVCKTKSAIHYCNATQIAHWLYLALLLRGIAGNYILAWRMVPDADENRMDTAVLGVPSRVVHTVLRDGDSVLAFLKSPQTGQNRMYGKIAFFCQLLCNAAWSVFFFGFHLPVAALVDISLLLTAIAASIYYFKKADRLSYFLLLPYFFWVSYALTLNIGIIVLN